MPKLVRTPFFADVVDAKLFGHAGAWLCYDAFFGIAKISAFALTDEDRRAIERLLGASLPQSPNTVARVDALDIAWVSPDEWLVLGEGAKIDDICSKAHHIFSGKAGFVLPMTHGRAVFRLGGEKAPDILSSLMPVDFHQSRFQAGQCAQTHFGVTGAFIQKLDEAPSYRILVDQAYAHYAWGALEDAAKMTSIQ